MSTIRNTKAVITETTVLADVEIILIIVDVDKVLHVISDFINVLYLDDSGFAKCLFKQTRLFRFRNRLRNKKKLVS